MSGRALYRRQGPMRPLLHQLLGASAHAWPENDAVVMEDRKLPYHALDEQANRFANSLRAHGVRRGDRVALWLPKSLEAVVALYGVMKAGAAYVPVDPNAPPARLAHIARDCEAAALVTLAARGPELDEAFAGRAPMRALWYADLRDDSLHAPRVAGLPGVHWAALASESYGSPDIAMVEDDLAYILYTSGSTGEPKGVALSHRNAIAFIEWAVETFEVGSDDRLANHAPFHFDLSTFDLFAAVAAGAAVHPVPPRYTSFPAAIAMRWIDEGLTIWYATPSALGLLLNRGGLANLSLSSLRLLLFAGEVMPVKLLRQLMALAPHARFANLYGPTETNVCTWYEVTSPPMDDAPLPIGKACSGDEALVLDEALAPVPDGGIGELWVRGASVMQGYWGKPERTALSLQTIEIAPGIKDIAYRTGDLVRRRPDGNLEFFGRRDHQIKTRGYRVELGEIEATLLRHPAVDEAVAFAVPDEEITNRIRSVVVLKGGDAAPAGAVALDDSALKAHCALTLPRYMVPETIEFRNELPRTSSGKVDRRALAGTEE